MRRGQDTHKTIDVESALENRLPDFYPQTFNVYFNQPFKGCLTFTAQLVFFFLLLLLNETR